MWFEGNAAFPRSVGAFLGAGSLRCAVCLLLLGLLPGRGPAEGAWPPALSAETDVVLLWSDQEDLVERKLTPSGRREVEDVVQGLFADVGIRVGWAEKTHGGATAIYVVVVPREADRWGLPRDAMGAVMGRQPESRVLYVFFPNVLISIGDRSPVTKTIREPGAMRQSARAMAGVIAHEVVHAIDPSVPHHDERGIMNARLTPKMLRKPGLGFTARTARLVRAHLSSGPERVSP